jgi:hypothetical protein
VKALDAGLGIFDRVGSDLLRTLDRQVMWISGHDRRYCGGRG